MEKISKLAAALWISFQLIHFAGAQGTAFTYQGRLSGGGAPAAGFYDLRFTVYDAATAGSAVSGTLTDSVFAITNGVFTVQLDFGPGIFPGAARWLEIAVRTNGANAFITLSPRQLQTAAPYAVTAGNVTGSLPASQLTGTLPSSLFAGTVLFTNPANAFSGDGGGLTNLAGTNVSGVQNVVNVKDYGALPSSGTIDCTLAISNAINSQQLLHRPLYFPSCPPGKYYKVSGSFVYNYLPWLLGVNIAQLGTSDTGARIQILADRGAIIVQTADKPVFVFTNGVNWVDIENLRIVNLIGAINSTVPGIAFYSRLSDGQNSDDINISQTEIEGFKYGLYSESGCEMHCDQVSLMYNQWPFWLVSTNAAGVSGTKNNSILFTTCEFVENKNGGFILGGNGVTFDSCEAGGPSQTNFVTIDSSSGLNVLFRGGNVELYHGAGIAITGPYASAINVKEEQWGLIDFSNGSCWNVYSTNTDYGPRLTIDTGAVGGLPIYDCASSHSITFQRGTIKVVGSNPSFGTFTNNFGAGSSQEMAQFLGVNYNGPAPTAGYEGMFSLKYNYDAKRRTMLSYGAVSNWGVNQKVFNYPLLQYNYDLADGKIPPVGITTNINVVTTGNKTIQLRFTRGVLTSMVP
jgi:hypothetical protein